MNTFIINDREVSVDLRDGKATLKTIRQNLNLRGTKEVCGEGDCGACMVLLGENEGDDINYKAVNSCLLPTGELGGKHVITIEGLNQERLSLIQETFVKEFAAQCGFCTPGFIVALTGFLLSTPDLDKDEAIQSISGNMCRCTGYVSIKRALFSILEKLNADDFKNTKPGSAARNELLIKENIIPPYFAGIREKIKNIQVIPFALSGSTIIAGGTDICVQKKGGLEDTEYSFLSQRSDLREIKMEQGKCFIGGAVTFEDLRNSEALEHIFPEGKKVFRLIASLPIRNRATIAGNIANASPIGDISIFLLTLDSTLLLNDGALKREVKLQDFFKGYKQMDKKENEIIEWVTFDMPDENTFLHFEKVSKRKYLDIASVNTAARITVKENIIQTIGLSAGGVGPFPLYLSKTCDFLKGKKIEEAVVDEAAKIADSEVSPISDTRGSEKYKRLLLSQLIRMHFIKLF